MAEVEEKALAWGDVETNGLALTGIADGSLRLLEVAFIVTDLDLNVLDETGYQAAIYQGTPEQVAALRARTDPFVQNMHDATGLWDRVADPAQSKPIEVVDAELVEYLRRFVPEPRTARMAGNSLRLDLNFAEVYLPRTYAHLHYRMFDATSIDAAARWWTDATPHFKKRAHTAMGDIRESIAEARHLREHLRAVRASRGAA